MVALNIIFVALNTVSKYHLSSYLPPDISNSLYMFKVFTTQHNRVIITLQLPLEISNILIYTVKNAITAIRTHISFAIYCDHENVDLEDLLLEGVEQAL